MRFEPKGITLNLEGKADWDGNVGAPFRAYRYAEDSPEINGCAAA